MFFFEVRRNAKRTKTEDGDGTGAAQKEFKIMQLTKDHSPMDWEERKRIQKAGVVFSSSLFFLSCAIFDLGLFPL
jgi:hypothetical protein